MGGAETARLPAGGEPSAPTPVACGHKGNTALPVGIDGHGTASLLSLDAGRVGLAQDASAADEPCGARLRVLGPSIGGRPATATAGQSAALDGLDFIPRVYEPPALRSEWDFDGDGTYDTAVDGYQARHTFAAPGRSPVTMRLTWTWPSGAAGSEVHRTTIDVVAAGPAQRTSRRARRTARHTPARLRLATLLRRGVTVSVGSAATVVELLAGGRVIGRRSVPARATKVTVRPRSRRAVRGGRIQVRARRGGRVLWREVVALRRR
jgi:hypothetical protein